MGSSELIGPTSILGANTFSFPPYLVQTVQSPTLLAIANETPKTRRTLEELQFSFSSQ